MKIEGRDNIQAHMQEELERMWKELELKHGGVRGQLFVALCLLINDSSRELRKKGIANSEDRNLFFRYETLLLTLDAFLEHGWNIVNPPGHSGEIQRFVDIIIRDFQDLGLLLSRIEDSRSHLESSLHIPDDKKVVDVSVREEKGFDEWFNRLIPDEDWIDYYYRESTPKKDEELRRRFERDTEKVLRTSPIGILKLRNALEHEMTIQMKKSGKDIPFFTFSKEYLIKVIGTQMGVSAIKAKNILKKLVYEQSRQRFLRPFVDVWQNGEKRYFVIPMDFIVPKTFTMAWIFQIARDTVGSETGGAMTKHWGDMFEKYIRELLRNHHSYLKVNTGRLKIHKKKFPNFSVCFGKNETDIDVIAQTDSTVYFISCKSADCFQSEDMILSFFRGWYKKFLNAIEDDIKNLETIRRAADCASRSKTLLMDRGFDGKRIIPLLVTSDVRPLSIAQVQEWCKENHLLIETPNVEIVLARDLKNYNFSA